MAVETKSVRKNNFAFIGMIFAILPGKIQPRKIPGFSTSEAGRAEKQKAPVQSCDRTEANWGLGVRHSLFPTLTLGAPSRGCQLPDAILHGKRSCRPHSRAVQRLAAAESSSEASKLAWAGVCGRRLANQVKTRL